VGLLTFLALRCVLVLVLGGSLVVQLVLLPLLAADLEGSELAGVRWPVLLIVGLVVLMIEVTVVCVWRLVTMVRRGTVFSSAAFRYVDVILGAISVASLLTLALGVVLAPGEAVAPGVVLLIGGVAVVVAGIALIVFVLRLLLAQAVARDTEALHLQAELDEVI
jgi:hypothetical protein